jgi:hypothetical protein
MFTTMATIRNDDNTGKGMRSISRRQTADCLFCGHGGSSSRLKPLPTVVFSFDCSHVKQLTKRDAAFEAGKPNRV